MSFSSVGIAKSSLRIGFIIKQGSGKHSFLKQDGIFVFGIQLCRGDAKLSCFIYPQGSELLILRQKLEALSEL